MQLQCQTVFHEVLVPNIIEASRVSHDTGSKVLVSYCDSFMSMLSPSTFVGKGNCVMSVYQTITWILSDAMR